MELRQIVQLLRRQWWVVLAGIVCGLAVALVALRLITPTYQSSVGIFVSAPGASTPDQLLSANTFSQQRAKVYADTITTPAVLGPVADSLNYPGGEAALERNVTASVALDSVVLDIAVRDQSPERAQGTAKAVSDQLSKTVATLDPGKPSPVTLTVLRPASLPTAPVSPSSRVGLVLGLLGGLVLGALAAAINDRRVRGRRSGARARA